MATWRDVWERKGREFSNDSEDALDFALRMNGYDSPTAGAPLSAAFGEFARAWAQRVGIASGESVYEVGAGTGAFLESIRRTSQTTHLSGSDMSQSLVDAGRDLFPGITLERSDAIDLPVDPKFDHVASFGVFFYFPDLDYAREVLRRMAAKAIRSVSVFDLPDVATREESEAYRRGAWSEDEYERKYEGLAHLYYPRDLFREELGDGWDVSVESQTLQGYGNAPYRFNVVAVRA